MSPKPFARATACAAVSLTAALALSGCGTDDGPVAAEAIGRVADEGGDLGWVMLLTVVGGFGVAALVIWLVIKRNRAAEARAKQVKKTPDEVPQFKPAVVATGNVPTVPPAQRTQLPRRTPGAASGRPAGAPAIPEPTKVQPAVRPEDLDVRQPPAPLVPEPTKLEPAVRREYLVDPSEPTEKQEAVRPDADPKAPTEKQEAVRPLADPERPEDAPVAPEETVLMPAVRLENLRAKDEATAEAPAVEPGDEPVEEPVWGAEYTAPMPAVSDEDEEDAGETPAEPAPERTQVFTRPEVADISPSAATEPDEDASPDPRADQAAEVASGDVSGPQAAVLVGDEIVEPASGEDASADEGERDEENAGRGVPEAAVLAGDEIVEPSSAEDTAPDDEVERSDENVGTGVPETAVLAGDDIVEPANASDPEPAREEPAPKPTGRATAPPPPEPPAEPGQRPVFPEWPTEPFQIPPKQPPAD